MTFPRKRLNEIKAELRAIEETIDDMPVTPQGDAWVERLLNKNDELRNELLEMKRRFCK